MTLPLPRLVLKGATSKNQSLQDILKTLTLGTTIISVEPHVGGIHNTKMLLSVDLGKGYTPATRYQQRVQFYNRLLLTSTIPVEANYPTDNIDNAIDTLNAVYGCDFTTDDVELVGGVLRAKDTSLGYFSVIPVGDSCACTMDHQAFQIARPQLDSNYTDPITNQYYGDTMVSWDIHLLVNGVVYVKHATQGDYLNDIINTIISENNLTSKISMTIENDGMRNNFHNLTNACGSIGVSAYPDVGDGLQHPPVVYIADTELCAAGETKLTCDSTADQFDALLSASGALAGVYELSLNGADVTLHTDQMHNTIPSTQLDIFQYILDNFGLYGCVSTYTSSGGGGQPTRISNETQDCLSMKFIYKGTDGLGNTSIIDHVFGTDPTPPGLPNPGVYG